MNFKGSNPLKFGAGDFDPTFRFETSWLLPPWVLFGCRALFSLYVFVVILFVLCWEATDHQGYTAADARNEFSYFTVLTYWGIAFYMLVAAIHTFSYALHGGEPLLNKFPRPLQALHYFFYTTITTFPFLVTIVYWSLLYSKFDTTFKLWSNVSQHGLNSFFALFELVFTRVNPPPWIHIPFLIVILGCYLGLAYLTYDTKHFYVYDFLNPNPKDDITLADGSTKNIGGVGKAEVAGYIIGILVGSVIIFAISKGAQALRKWITEKKLGMEGKFVDRTIVREVDVEVERKA